MFEQWGISPEQTHMHTLSVLSHKTFLYFYFVSNNPFSYTTATTTTTATDAKRSLMIVRRSPGPWEDKSGPIVLGSLFVLSLVAQFCIYMASYIAQSQNH